MRVGVDVRVRAPRTGEPPEAGASSGARLCVGPRASERARVAASRGAAFLVAQRGVGGALLAMSGRPGVERAGVNSGAVVPLAGLALRGRTRGSFSSRSCAATFLRAARRRASPPQASCLGVFASWRPWCGTWCCSAASGRLCRTSGRGHVPHWSTVALVRPT